MPDLFASPKRRIARAKEKVEGIHALNDSFANSKPYAQVVERKPNGFEYHKVQLTKEIPGEITDLAYEALEALRSSLDQAVYAVAEACNAKAPGTIKRLDLIHFPVGNDAADFENILKGRIKDLPSEILALFRIFKPYKGGNDPIWSLNQIRRQGTHRLIVPVMHATAGINVRYAEISRPLPLDILPPKWDGEKNEIIFIRTGIGSQVKYDVNLGFYVAFGNVEGVAGAPVLDTLIAMATEVEKIVSATETACRGIRLI